MSFCSLCSFYPPDNQRIPIVCAPPSRILKPTLRPLWLEHEMNLSSFPSLEGGIQDLGQNTSLAWIAKKPGPGQMDNHVVAMWGHLFCANAGDVVGTLSEYLAQEDRCPKIVCHFDLIKRIIAVATFGKDCTAYLAPQENPDEMESLSSKKKPIVFALMRPGDAVILVRENEVPVKHAVATIKICRPI